jgi:hypothetical protein
MPVSHHFLGDKCHLLTQGINGRSHRESVVPDVCLKKDQQQPLDQLVRPVGDQYSENHSHFYCLQFKHGDHFLCVPPPFPLGGNRSPRFYEPAMACLYILWSMARTLNPVLPYIEGVLS